MAPLAEALAGTEWILHAATQDLPCLAEARAASRRALRHRARGPAARPPPGRPGTLVETVLGFRMKKEHSAVDWSTRPLPEPWLEYAALDVEVLAELREALGRELDEAGQGRVGPPGVRPPAVLRADPARRRVAAYLRHAPGPRPARLWVRCALWLTRDELAEQRDVTAGPDHPRRRDRRRRPGDAVGPGRPPEHQGLPPVAGAERYSARWVAALAKVAEPRSTTCRPARRAGTARPSPGLGREGPGRRPAPGPGAPRPWRPWPSSTTCRSRTCSTPDYLRRTLWAPPRTREPEQLAGEVDAALTALGARRWQVELTGPVLIDAILRADQEPRRSSPRLLRSVGAGAVRFLGLSSGSTGSSTVRDASSMRVVRSSRSSRTGTENISSSSGATALSRAGHTSSAAGSAASGWWR